DFVTTAYSMFIIISNPVRYCADLRSPNLWIRHHHLRNLFISRNFCVFNSEGSYFGIKYVFLHPIIVKSISVSTLFCIMVQQELCIVILEEVYCHRVILVV
ncbi:hypothetical protein ACJX0J_033890, partial [Zea mays]